MTRKITLPFQRVPVQNSVLKNRYYTCVVTAAGFCEPPKDGVLRVEFVIQSGKYAGFKLKTDLNPEYKGDIRLSYLLEAVSLEILESPDQLVGRKLKIRVLPRWNSFTKRYRYPITRFKSLQTKRRSI